MLHARSLIPFFLLAVLLTSLAASASHFRSRERSAHLLHRNNIPVEGQELHNETEALVKRDSYNGRATFFDVGLGACGWWNQPSDLIVAQNSAQFGSSYPSPNCGRSITISYNGVQVAATIADECPTCPWGGLDMSTGLFTRFADESVGVFYMTWWYNDGDNSGGPAPSSDQPQPTSTWQAPTSTWQAPSSTTTTTSKTVNKAEAQTTSLSTSSTTASTSTTSSSTSKSAATTSIIPSGVVSNGTVLPLVVTASNTTSNATVATTAPDTNSTVPTEQQDLQTGNLEMVNQIVANYGKLIVVAAGAS